MSEQDAGRKLYVSLSGTERADWGKSLAAIAGGIFVSGLLIGAGLMGLRTSPEKHSLPEVRA